MRQRNISLLVGIIILAAVLIWIDQPNNPGLRLNVGNLVIDRDIRIHQGLDLQGGLQVLLEADVPADQQVAFDAQTMQAARVIVENRVNGLGVTEPLVQLQGDQRIIVELPGIEDPDQAIATLRETGLLEFVEGGRAGVRPLAEGMRIHTSLDAEEGEGTGQTITGTTTLTGTDALTATEYAYPDWVFPTLMTGRHLKDAGLTTDDLGQVVIAFELTDEGAQIFRDYSIQHVGDIVAIVLDKEVVSAPVINQAITGGSGIISSNAPGGFPLEEARDVSIKMKYGALPVPLKVVENRTIGPTLGQDSIQRSIQAGVIGLLVVLLFMITYYRLPGFLADLALIIYALLNFALYKLIPVTLTLPAITGFILSMGMAVDANILVFERMKEELRAGRSIKVAMEAGFSRAWTSIRDSNLSTLITCGILFWFGSNFGAGIVKGFAITLALGLVINLFTAIVVTRTFMRVAFDVGGDGIRKHMWLLGVFRMGQAPVSD
jgi:protein-export membrane protein SecD